MTETKILHTGDLHIGASRTAVPNGKTEIKNTFFRIVDICKTESIDFLLISGDLFDTPFVDSDTASEIIGAMSKLPETIIAVSPGNHDCFCTGSVYHTFKFPDNVVIFSSDNTKFDIPHKNVCLYGSAFSEKFEKTPLMPTYTDINPERINIGVVHGDIVSSTAESDYNPITPSYISDCGFDYLALGHIHKRSKIEKHGNTFFAYCGCPDGKGFDEDGSQGVYIGNIRKNQCNIEFRELSSRKYIVKDINISHCTTSLEVSSKIMDMIKSSDPDGYADNLYRINLTGTVGANFSPSTSIISETLGNELFYVQIADHTEPDISDISIIAKEKSLRGIFVSGMLKRINSASHQDREKNMAALKIGLKAFEREVSLNDN